MTTEHLLVADADGVRTLTINRPDAKNALTLAMRLRLCELLSEAEQRAFFDDMFQHAYLVNWQKGDIALGLDADLVLVDLSARRSFEDEAIVSKAGWSPYAAHSPRGLP